jgi:hypothetical protein
MKIILTLLKVLCLILLTVSAANAVTCAKGTYRAGCAGPNGAVVTTPRPPAAVVVPPPRAVVVAPPARVVTPAVNCTWVNGRKVCR